jgi:hypothetical protein
MRALLLRPAAQLLRGAAPCRRAAALRACTAAARSFAAAASEEDSLQAWHAALAAAAPPRRLLLPRGHPDGSLGCDTVALLGDALLRAAVLRALGAGDEARHGRRLADWSNDVSAAVCNATLSAFADAALAPSVAAADLAVLPQHGRATALEAAAAHVHAFAGDAPLDALACALLRRVASAGGVCNWKGLLLECGGAVEASASADGAGFVAVARLGRVSATSDAWPTKLAAETQAAQAALQAAGLGSAQERATADEADARAAMTHAASIASATLGAVAVPAARDLLFRPLTVNAQSLAQARVEGRAWFRRGVEKDTFQRMLGAPLALPHAVRAVHAWGGSFAGQGTDAGDTDADFPPSLSLAVMAVTLASGQQRWFLSGAQPSQNKAKNAVARLAALELALLDAAAEDAE